MTPLTGKRIMPHPAALPESELLAACELTRTRRGGPGGQHRNKVETAVVITHLPSGVSAEANERRSQAENRKVAIQRLRVHLALAIRGSVDTSQAPSDLWRHYTSRGKLAVSSTNSDFPAVLAEAMDYLAEAKFEPAAAAQRLGVTSSQLLKLLQTEPAAWGWLQENRRRLGLRTLFSRGS